MRTECSQVHDDLADLVAGDAGAIDRHADHLAGCDDCRDARYEATRLASLLPHAGADHVSPPDLVERLLARLDAPALARGSSDTPTAAQTLPGIAVAAETSSASTLHGVAPAVSTTAPTAALTAEAPTATPTAAAPAPITAMTAGAPAATAPTVEAPAATAPTVEAPATRRPSAAQPVARSSARVDLDARRRRTRRWLAAGALAAVAAGTVGVYVATRGAGDAADGAQVAAADGAAATVKSIDRASADRSVAGLELRAPGESAWRPVRTGEAIPNGAEVRSDERTRAAVELADGTRLVLDHKTTLAFDPLEARRTKLTAGRLVADVAHVDGRPAAIDTPAGRVDVVGTKLAVTAGEGLTVVQVVRGSVKLVTPQGKTEAVHAGEEGVIDARQGNATLSVDAAPGLAREVEWSELDPPKTKPGDTTGTGIGALRAYKPGESRDRDWNLALAKHDVKVRVSGPVARTEITETFRNDANETLEGVYQFPLPPDAQIDALWLDDPAAPGKFIEGAFLDKERAQKIWRGVIDKAAPKKQELATSEIIWVEGAWRDPALLDWKRGGRFELRIFPIPAKGARTIKIAYTQVVTPRGPWRQYVYPLPHSADGSTVADQLTVDVEVRGAARGDVRAAGYDLVADPARKDVNALTLSQRGFVPRGDLVVTYRASDGDAEVRAWTFAGGAAAAPDDKLADKKNVGIDPKVVEAQRAVAADARPTAVLALRPKLPRWRAAESRDYVIVVDSSQSMLGERYARSTELATRLVEQMDRRDRFSVMACDSECRSLGDLRAASVRAGQDAASWLAAQAPAGASDLVASVRAAATAIPASAGRERWVIYIGDGFATTGFRRSGDIEKAIASWVGSNTRVTTIGIGTDADPATLGAVARGGGGSYLAWVPGQSVKTAAIAGLESTYGTALRDATIELPAGLADVAPTVLPTVRAGEEILVAARVTGDVTGQVIVRGSVGGQPFEQKYPLKLAVSSASGNGFVPRLWASLAIEQLERRGRGEDRARLVALSQGYGVMSKETSLLVLESQAMFDAFGVDRSRPAAPAWTGEETLDEVVSTGTIAHGGKRGPGAAPAADAPADVLSKAQMPATKTQDATGSDGVRANLELDEKKARWRDGEDRRGGWGGRFAMRRTWIRVPSVSAYDTVHPAITKAIGDAERALAKSPDSRERHRNLVQALSYAGEIDRAHAVATKWLARDQLDPQALGYQADLLGRDGKRELGLRTLAGVVDLDADRVAPHERMVTAYESIGRLAQACSHRIAMSAIAPKAETAKLAAGAIRCLRTLGRVADAELVVRGLPDDATRVQAGKLAEATTAPPKIGGDLVVEATWDSGDDLDLTLVTPDGTRVSWMGGRTDVVVGDATSGTREQLAVKSLKRGHYLIEIGRGTASTRGGATKARGKLDIAVLGAKKSLPFELTGARVVVGRISVNLEERLESIDTGSTVPRVAFGAIPDERVRRVVLARSRDIQQCYAQELNVNPGAAGRLTLAITINPSGGTRTVASGPMPTAARCIEGALGNMHVEGSAARTIYTSVLFSTGG